MEFNEKYKLHDEQYYHDKYDKHRIYLHHTVGGSAVSTIGWWNTSKIHVGTAFIIEREGTIYRVFDEAKWAYHLGLKTNFNKKANYSSIGIELASEGALRSGSELNTILVREGVKPRMRDDILYAFDINPNRKFSANTWFRRAKPLYNILEDSDLFNYYPEGFRGYNYFDAYDEPQIVATIKLINYLCDKYDIPKVGIGEDYNRFELALAVDFRGILTHTNVRLDKSDVHPAFPFHRIFKESYD